MRSSRPQGDTPPRRGRMPAWLRRPLARPGAYTRVGQLVSELDLHTVCESAKCPNRGECYSAGTATFMVMGGVCTRACRFCAVASGAPDPLDPDEPRRVAEAAERLGLTHVVVTSVTRDDIADGGAGHFAAVVRALRQRIPDATIEVLTSDFGGDMEAVDRVLGEGPDVFNHNVETVPRLYPDVRPQADYARSLAVLARARESCSEVPTKSGLMLGLGEQHSEVLQVMQDLRAAGVELLTLGQYLQPSPGHLQVRRFVEPSEFASLAREGYRMGFSAVASAPFVRSSYHAGELVSQRTPPPASLD